ncbi:MAG: glycogen synthase [Desulfobacteraceae bacterium]|nr:MAG: glycogen synthase [Desulfobacteraceae bacterium]
MNILLLTNEYPPNVYGGAGVHVGHLCRELARIEDAGVRLQVLCFGEPAKSRHPPEIIAVPGPSALFSDLRHAKFLDTLYRNVVMAGTAAQADLIHCHTWYTYLAGCLLKQIMSVPLVVTLHSLEPQRPWKKEQLGNAYFAAAWLEKTALHNADAVIAVSTAMRQDVLTLYDIEPGRLRVIYNGIDLQRYTRVERPDIVARYGIDPDRPYVLFVGRITRQKGILHLVRALPLLDKGVQAVLCAGAPDTAAIGAQMEELVRQARSHSENDIVWISKMIPEDDLAALYSHAAVFVCPSVYEPFGIINLEAMACGTPVVASAVGGIPEVVVHEQTGLLVPLEPAGGGDPEPRQPRQYAGDLAAAINKLLRDPARRAALGAAARERAERHFGWNRIAEHTLGFYREVVEKAGSA